MTIFRGYTYRLEPTVSQEETFNQFAGVCRLVYNLCLEQRDKWWRQYKKATGKLLNLATQGRQITELRNEVEWIKAVPADCLQAVVRDLDRNFAAFFAGRSKFPRYRKKDVSDGFRVRGRDVPIRHLNKKWSMARIPKIGWVKYRKTRHYNGEVKSISISRDVLGWKMSLACEVEHDIVAPHNATIGIDRGVTTTLALSNGEMLLMPDSLQVLETQKRRAQRVVSRRKRGSSRRRRAQARVSRLQAKQARVRRDFHHRAALVIAKQFGVAVIEDLKTRNMTASARGTVAEPGMKVRQKAGLNRAILNAGWRQFQTILTYKMEERGGQVITVPARFTSQTCPACGVIDARSRESQATFRCVSCGHTANADTNAAINIERRWSTPLLDVEGLHQRPREASTVKDLKGLEEPSLLID